jgi:hypothetical protein
MTRRGMRAITTDGPMWLPDLNDHDASLVGQHQNAVKRFLRYDDPTGLDRFRDVVVAGHRLETRLRQLEALGLTDELSYESIYEDPK